MLLKGRWVVVDGARLGDVLDRWKKAEAAAAERGIGFVEAMRLLSGVAAEAAPDDAAREDAAWATVTAGPWLDELLGKLREPADDGASARDGAEPRGLSGTLRPYQRAGVRPGSSCSRGSASARAWPTIWASARLFRSSR